MKINLRKANALQNAIMDALRDLHFETEVEVNEFQDAESQVNLANEAWKKTFVRRSSLLDAFYAIRSRVGRANVEAGISDVLADVARLEKDIAMLGKLAVSDVRVDQEVLAGKMEKIRARSTDDTSMYGRRDQVVETSIFTEEDVQGFKVALAKNKKSKQRLQDRLLELNVETQIDLDDVTVEVLTKEDLI